MNLATKCAEKVGSDCLKLDKTVITQTCMLTNGVDLYHNLDNRLVPVSSYATLYFVS